MGMASNAILIRVQRAMVRGVMVSAALGAGLLGSVLPAVSGLQRVQAAPAQAVAERSAQQWLQRWQQASRQQSYAGTLAMSGERGNLRSARVWHAVRDGRQIERVDNLSGSPRSIFRTEHAVHVFLRDKKELRIRTNMPRQATLFPGMMPLPGQLQAEAARYYRASHLGQERVANHVADVVAFAPVDGLRYAYRFWSDQKTGLLLKWQMLSSGATSAQADVLREVAFSDLQIQAPLSYALLEGMMKETSGYRVQQTALRATTLQQQGWAWRKPLAGYFVTHCYLRPPESLSGRAPSGPAPRGSAPANVAASPVTHCVLSDGLSSISLFFRPASAEGAHAVRSKGATSIRSQGIAGQQVTAVGEVPPAALQQLLDSLQRTSR